MGLAKEDWRGVRNTPRDTRLGNEGEGEGGREGGREEGREGRRERERLINHSLQ